MRAGIEGRLRTGLAMATAALVGLTAACQQAQTVEHVAEWPFYQSLDALYDAADVVVVANIRDDATVQERETIVYTVVSINVMLVVKGSVAVDDTIAVKQEGGTYEGVSHTYAGIDHYLQAGGRYVLFLATVADSPASWLNPTQGLYPLDASGQPTALPGNPVTFTMTDLTALAVPS